jgi:bleomycin hydrolase
MAFSLRIFAKILLLCLACQPLTTLSQNKVFRTTIHLDATSVKDQAFSSTCWSFASLSFLESELLRMGKGTHDLSEMYIVRCVWPEKANQYIRLHGRCFLTPGGQPHDVFTAVSRYGLVPEEVYSGLPDGKKQHNHRELDSVAAAFIQAVLNSGSPTTCWQPAFQSLLDVYLGPLPDTFSYGGAVYTPTGFASAMGINSDDYIQLTSFGHFPFNKWCILDSRFNWANGTYFNLPYDDLLEVANYALQNGFTLLWNGDVSEDEFRHHEAMALMPGETADAAKRDAMFEQRLTTVDHVMHITGASVDDKNAPYFNVKNSWGYYSNSRGGYVFMSEVYFMLKTLSFTVHKSALPPRILKLIKKK